MSTVRRPGGLGVLLLTALLAEAAYLWWAGAVVPHEPPAPAPVPAAAPAPASPASPLLALPPERMREALHAEYRLQPDRRCLTAFAEVQAWFGGRDPLPVSATFAESAWRIEIAGEGVGTLPELPDFGDCMTGLEKLASVVGKGKGAGRVARAPAPGGGARLPGLARVGAGALRRTPLRVPGAQVGARAERLPAQPGLSRGHAVPGPHLPLPRDCRHELDAPGARARPLHGQRRRRGRDRRPDRPDAARAGRRPGAALRGRARPRRRALPGPRARRGHVRRVLRRLLLLRAVGERPVPARSARLAARRRGAGGRAPRSRHAAPGGVPALVPSPDRRAGGEG